MIDSIKSLGFKYTTKNDLVDKQFTLVDKMIEENYSTLSQLRFAEIQTFTLFTKSIDYDYLTFANNLKGIRYIQRGAKSLLIEELTIEVIKQENGLEANLKIQLSEV